MNTRRAHTRRSTSLGVLPLTSMIDVVFLLLVYFLVTSSFRDPEREIDSSLQTEGGGTRSSELQPQIVEVILTQDGGVVYRLGGRVMRNRAALREVLVSLPKEPGLAVRSERDVPIGAIAGVLQDAQDAGFIRRSYVPREQ